MLGQEVMDRQTERAAIRSGAAVVIIARDAEEHDARGEQRRTDGFFDDRGELRPESHELLEAILLASANCFEERKLPYVAHIFSEVSFDANTTPANSLFLARIADQLTYCQLIAVEVFGGRIGELAELPRPTRHRDSTVSRELDDLAARGLLGVEHTDHAGARSIRNPLQLFGGSSMADADLSTGRLTESGLALRRLMRLDTMPRRDLENWMARLERQPGAYLELH